MADNVLLPALDPQGWIDDSQIKIDYIFSHFFESDYSQTYLHEGKVASFSKLLQENQKYISDLVSKTQEILTSYFNNYFPSVTVEVLDASDSTEPSIGKISIYVSVTDYLGKTYSLGNLIRYNDMKVLSIIKINNGE